MLRRLSFCFIFCVALAACGGSGSSGSLVPQSPASNVPSALSVQVTIAIPAAPAIGSAGARRPQYASVNTHSAAVSVDGGKPVVTNLSSGTPGCVPIAGGGRTCTTTVSATTGKHTFAVSLYATTDGSGAALSQNTASATIVAGIANVVSMTLDGIVASVVVSLANPAPPVGTAATIGLAVNFKDASGALIIGQDPFVNPIALTDSDTSGATTISKPVLASPADAAALTLAYTGAAIAQAVIGATANGVPAANITPATLTPAAVTASALVDWPGYAYDNARTGYNPFSTSITPTSIAGLHTAWQTTINGATQTQPIVVTNVAGHAALLIIGNFAIAQAYDALTGKLVWSHTLPTQDVQDCGLGGISGTAAYDKALGAIFMAAGSTNPAPNHVILYRLDVGSGATTGQVDVTPNLLPGEGNYAHSGVTFANGRVYLGTGSDCEGTPTGKYPYWRGRVVSVDPGSMTLSSTFYTTWGQGGNYGGGGVWGWGGVSSDASGNVFSGSGNGQTAKSVAPQTIQPPFDVMPNEYSGFAEHLFELTPDLNTLKGANFPGFDYNTGGGDLDYTGTPVVFQPTLAGCGELTATQGKGGTLVVNSTVSDANGNLPVMNSFKLSVPSSGAYYVGNPAYSPKTGYLYAAISSAGPGSSLLPPGLAAIGGCASSITWNTQFGPDSTQYGGENPRSAPTVTAGGVVLIGTPCTNDGKGNCGTPGTVNGALWAVDATTGTLLGGGKPLLMTADNIRMAPSVDGSWIFVLDGSGNMYGLTVDPSIKAIASKPGLRVPRALRRRVGD